MIKERRKNEKNRKEKKRERNEIQTKKKRSLHKAIIYKDYIMALSKAKALQLNSKKRIK